VVVQYDLEKRQTIPLLEEIRRNAEKRLQDAQRGER
jgi:hypothetical protein